MKRRNFKLFQPEAMAFLGRANIHEEANYLDDDQGTPNARSNCEQRGSQKIDYGVTLTSP